MKRFPAAVVAIAALAGTVGLTTPVSAATRGVTVHTRHTSLGVIVVAHRGHSLYLFAKDRHHASSCYGSCAQTWPPLLTNGSPRAGRGVKPGLLGTTRRHNGRLQVTYNGHPLYFFAGDSSAGQTSGEGLNSYGANWYVVNKRGHRA